MNVFICMVTTANGLITAGVPHNDWVPESSWNNYLEKLASCDAAIVGSKTYDVMHDEEFVPGVKYFVLTNSSEQTSYRENVTGWRDSPAALTAQLEKDGCKQVGIFGGAQTISSFLQAGVVNELYQDVAAFISGNGKNLVAADVGEYKLELLETKQLDKSTIQLHYKILHT